MSIKSKSIVASLLLWSVIVLTGRSQSVATNSASIKDPSGNEKWSAISNRWSAVPWASAIQSAESGDAVAQYYVAQCYQEGYGVAKSTQEGLKWLKKASDSGYAKA